MTTYVDDIDNSLGLFGLTAAVSSDVDIALGDENVAIWHGYLLSNVLGDMFSEVFFNINKAKTHLFEWIIRDRNERCPCFLGFTTLRLVEYFAQRLDWRASVYRTCMAFASANTTVLLSHTWFAFSNFGFGCWCHVECSWSQGG